MSTTSESIPTLLTSSRPACERVIKKAKHEHHEMNPVAMQSYSQMWSEAANRFSGLDAIIFDGVGEAVHYTFGELESSANRLARNLKEKFKISAGDLIVTAMENRPEAFTLMISCQKLGAVFVPLATDLQHKDCHAVVKMYSPKLVICDQPKYMPFSPEECSRALLIPNFRDGENVLKEMMVQGSADSIDCVVDPNAPSIIFSTSGSTGLPKGVMHSNKAIAEWGAQRGCFGVLEFQPGEKNLSWIHIRGGGTFFTLMQLLDGVTQVVVDSYPGGPAEWAKLIGKYDIDHMVLFGAAMDRMQRELFKQKFPSVKSVIYGGSCFSPSLVQASMEQFPNAEFVQGYGMTETMLISFLQSEFHKRKGHATAEDLLRMSSAGRPLSSREDVFIEDLQQPFSGNPPADGSGIGQICFKPKVGMLGYFKNQEKTAEVWDGIAMRTGDVGKIDDEGFVYVLGRVKDIIPSSRGFNITPRDIEEVLYQHPAVGEAAVVGVYHPSGAGEAVVAFVSLKAGSELEVSAEELSQHCVESMPAWQMPDAIHVVREPLPKKDKMDRKAMQGSPFRQKVLANELLCAFSNRGTKSLNLNVSEQDEVQALFKSMRNSLDAFDPEKLLKVFGNHDSTAQLMIQLLTSSQFFLKDWLQVFEAMGNCERRSFILQANSLLEAPSRLF